MIFHSNNLKIIFLLLIKVIVIYIQTKFYNISLDFKILIAYQSSFIAWLAAKSNFRLF